MEAGSDEWRTSELALLLLVLRRSMRDVSCATKWLLDEEEWDEDDVRLASSSWLLRREGEW